MWLEDQKNGLLEQTIFYLNPKKKLFLLYSVIFVAIS